METFSKDDLLKEMDEAGVDAAVIHPPSSWDPDSNELAVEAARQHPDRLAILGNFPIERPESRPLMTIMGILRAAHEQMRLGHRSDSTNRARPGRQWSRKRCTKRGASSGTN